MFKEFIFIVALVSFSILTGCASVPMASQEQDTAAKTFRKPSEDKAGLYVYRNSFVGQALTKAVYLDSTLLGETANKTFFYKEIKKGEHRLSTESEFGDNDLSIKADGGKNYFVEQVMKMGLFVGGSDLQMVTEEEGMKEVLNCNLASLAEENKSNAGSNSAIAGNQASDKTAAAKGNNRFSFNISNISVAENIFDRNYTYTPKEGNRFVLVTIAGVYPKDKEISVRCNDFKAQTEKDTTTATAIGTTESPYSDVIISWAVGNSSIKYSDRKVDLFRFIICFSLSKETKNFQFIYGNDLIGSVRVPLKSEVKK